MTSCWPGYLTCLGLASGLAPANPPNQQPTKVTHASTPPHIFFDLPSLTLSALGILSPLQRIGQKRTMELNAEELRKFQIQPGRILGSADMLGRGKATIPFGKRDLSALGPLAFNLAAGRSKKRRPASASTFLPKDVVIGAVVRSGIFLRHKIRAVPGPQRG